MSGLGTFCLAFLAYDLKVRFFLCVIRAPGEKIMIPFLLLSYAYVSSPTMVLFIRLWSSHSIFLPCKYFRAYMC